MNADQSGDLPKQASSPEFAIRLAYILYASVLLGITLAMFGVFGLAVAFLTLFFWGYVFCRRFRPRALAEACLMLLLFCGCLIVLFVPVSAARDAARRVQCGNNLRQLALALHSYHDAYGRFPPAIVPDQEGRPMHSWRVLILPFLQQDPWYHQYDFIVEDYDFEEPWDGPNNRRLVSSMPLVYQCPSHARTGRRQWTSYLAVVGAQTAWPGSDSSELSDFSGGRAMTILVLEDHSQEIPWTEPRDLTFEQAASALSSQERPFVRVHRQDDFFYEHTGLRQAVFADGRVRPLFDGLSRDLVTGLLRIDESRDLSLVDWATSPARKKRLKLLNCLLLAMFVTLALLPLPWVWIKPYAPYAAGNVF